MSADLDTLTTPATRAEIEERIYAALAARGAKTTGWKPGSVARSIIVGVSIVLAGFSQLQALIAKSGFLEQSEGDWLKVLAKAVYDVEASDGDFARPVVTVDNTGGGVYSGDPDDLVFSNSSNGKTYRNTAAFSIAGLETGVEIQLQAVEIGTDSNAGVDEIDGLETPLPGVVIDGSTAGLGRDPEEDPEIRTRCLEKTGTLSPNGPADAYSFVCRSATREDGSEIGVSRVRSVADGEGGIIVYVATDTAVPLSPDIDILQSLVETKAEPNAVTAVVAAAEPITIPVTYELWVRDTSGLTNGQIQTLVGERLLEFMAAQPIGGVKLLTSDASGKVFKSAIESVIGSAASGTGLARREVSVVVTAPAADVELDISEAPVLGTVTVVAIHQVPGGLV